MRIIRKTQKRVEEARRLKKLEIPSLNLDKLKQYATNEPKTKTNLLAKKEVLSERGDKEGYGHGQKQEMLYGNHKQEGVLSEDQNTG